MRPAVGLFEVSALLFQRIVRGVAVGKRNACVVSEHLFGRCGAAAAFERVVHGIRTANGPSLPALALASLLLTRHTHELPVSLIDANHGLRKDVDFESVVSRLQMCSEPLELVPQGL